MCVYLLLHLFETFLAFRNHYSSAYFLISLNNSYAIGSTLICMRRKRERKRDKKESNSNKNRREDHQKRLNEREKKT